MWREIAELLHNPELAEDDPRQFSFQDLRAERARQLEECADFLEAVLAAQSPEALVQTLRQTLGEEAAEAEIQRFLEGRRKRVTDDGSTVH